MTESMKDWLYLSFWLTVFFAFFAFLWWKDTEAQDKMTAQEKQRQTHCLGKSNQARPACWREADWDAYCKRVECKSVTAK